MGLRCVPPHVFTSVLLPLLLFLFFLPSFTQSTCERMMWFHISLCFAKALSPFCSILWGALRILLQPQTERPTARGRMAAHRPRGGVWEDGCPLRPVAAHRRQQRLQGRHLAVFFKCPPSDVPNWENLPEGIPQEEDLCCLFLVLLRGKRTNTLTVRCFVWLCGSSDLNSTEFRQGWRTYLEKIFQNLSFYKCYNIQIYDCTPYKHHRM